MRILGNPLIGNAAISMTNTISTSEGESLKTFTLVDRANVPVNNTVIDIDFGSNTSCDAVAICGTNLSENATIQLSYSSTDITTPDTVITMTEFSTFNQVFFLNAAVSKRYWRISISDSSLSELFIGYVYIGEYHQVSAVEFGHEPALNIRSSPSVTNTGQGYGSKLYNSHTISGNMFADYDELEKFLDIVQARQNIERVLIVEYEESYDLNLYRPKYGILSADNYPFAMTDDTPQLYGIGFNFEERF